MSAAPCGGLRAAGYRLQTDPFPHAVPEYSCPCCCGSAPMLVLVARSSGVDRSWVKECGSAKLRSLAGTKADRQMSLVPTAQHQAIPQPVFSRLRIVFNVDLPMQRHRGTWRQGGERPRGGLPVQPSSGEKCVARYRLPARQDAYPFNPCSSVVPGVRHAGWSGLFVSEHRVDTSKTNDCFFHLFPRISTRTRFHHTRQTIVNETFCRFFK